MSGRIQLPHTRTCLVCGQENPVGLRLTLYVEPETCAVSTGYTSRPHDVGFEGIIHGGILTAICDEVMVWSAIWASGRACVAAELNMRFKNVATVHQTYHFASAPKRVHGRLVEAEARVTDDQGRLIAIATGKFSPLPMSRTHSFGLTLHEEPAVEEAMKLLKQKFFALAGQ